MDEQQFNQLQKTIIIPHRSIHNQILQQLQTDQPNFLPFLDNVAQDNQFINGELVPIFIVYQQPINIQHEFQLKQGTKQLRIYQSYGETELNIPNQFKVKSQNQEIYCKVLQVSLNEELLEQNIDLIIFGTYQSCYTIDNFTNILRNEIPKEQYKLLQYQQVIPINVINAYEMTYKYFGNTIKMNIAFKINQNVELQDIETDFLLSESTMVWKDVGINRQVPKCMLDNISINKQYISEQEGFVEILLDWPAMLLNEELQPNLPSRRLSVVQVNPVLEITTPLYVKWGKYKTTKCHKILWKVKPISQLGAEITEVVRYQDAQQQEYLALKIILTNYSGKQHEIVFCPPPQIFGKKLNQKKDQPLVVLGITLSTEKNLGILQPCQQCETILRVQLINNGILNMQSINILIDGQQTEVNLNFLHSYQ